ncbi:MAG: FAD-dependent oxidoreductase, partial [Pseudonocardia sp.]|nr:FAD-dependent oxidoreductase [Pseudonocardia sp.]
PSMLQQVDKVLLLRQGAGRVLVIDGYESAGGNHRDAACGGYTFDVGSFIFQDDSPLLAHFPELLERYVPIEPTWTRLTPQGMVTTYPFSVRDDLFRAGPVECARILLSALWARIAHRRQRTARDYARYWLGARLLRRSGLESYMERFCGLPADRIDLRFARSRMGWIAEYATVRTVTRTALAGLRKQPVALRTNQQLARPPEGFAHLYSPVVKHLEEAGVTFRLGAAPTSLDREGDGFRLALPEGEVWADRVVSTIPVDHARALCGLPGTPLPVVTLISLFCSVDGDRGFGSSILYNFDLDGTWKRLTMYSDFYGERHGRQYFGVEVIAGHVTGVADAFAGFRRHTARHGLLGGDLRLEGGHVLEHAYPIYTDGAGERSEEAIATLRAFGVESFGRQGGFEYQPTARQSTLVAEAALVPERSAQ